MPWTVPYARPCLLLLALGGISMFSWVFPSTCLPGSNNPICKLADLYGRRRVFAWGRGFYPWFGPLRPVPEHDPANYFPCLQGLSRCCAADYYYHHWRYFSFEERARMQVCSAVSGVSIIGPALGGVIVDFLDWRWIFTLTYPSAWFLSLCCCSS